MTKHEEARNFATWLVLMGVIISIVWLTLGLGFMAAGLFVFLSIYLPKDYASKEQPGPKNER